MNESSYNALLPFVDFFKATYVCIDKSLPTSNPPSDVMGLIISVYNQIDPNTRPVDTGCSACITEAIKTVTIRFIGKYNEKIK